MKKILLAISISLMSASVFASTSFRWLSVTGGALDNTGASLSVGQTVLAYYSSDAVINFTAPVPGGTLANDYGNDHFLGSASSGAVAGRYMTAYFSDPSDTLIGSYVYLVLVNTAYSVGATPLSVSNPGNYFGVSSVTSGPLSQSSAPGSPQTFSNAALIQTSSQITAVPEPSSLALFGIGAVLIGLRKLRK